MLRSSGPVKKKTKTRYGKYQAIQNIFILIKFLRHIDGLNITPINNIVEISKVIANRIPKMKNVEGSPLMNYLIPISLERRHLIWHKLLLQNYSDLQNRGILLYV